MTAAEPERRQTPSERAHEALLAAITRRPAAEQSVTISRNAKGVAQFEVTCRADRIEDAMTWAIENYQHLCRALPYPDANGGES